MQARLKAKIIEPALRALGIWAPAGFVLIYATATVLFSSGALLGLAGGALFGPVWGTLCNLIGATLGATVAFLLARTVAGERVARRVGGHLRRLVVGGPASFGSADTWSHVLSEGTNWSRIRQARSKVVRRIIH
jgi:uncharacterized membrane protein YdjX (TVP38/TMEM64 family)